MIFQWSRVFLAGGWQVAGWSYLGEVRGRCCIDLTPRRSGSYGYGEHRWRTGERFAFVCPD